MKKLLLLLWIPALILVSGCDIIFHKNPEETENDRGQNAAEVLYLVDSIV